MSNRRGPWARLVLSLMVALAAVSPLRAQEGTQIFGRVTAEGGRPVSGATVRALAPDGARTLAGALTDREGGYRLSGLPEGSVRLRVEHLGYQPMEREVRITSSGSKMREDFVLPVFAIEVQGLDIVAPPAVQRERERFEEEAGMTARVVGGPDLKFLPGLAEADVLRAVELLPGVVSTSDFSSAFNVRGGSADQNLILLDGFPIFNPFHLGGLFSVFNSDVIARAELLAGGFGAEYGGRVSSVLTVETQADAEPGLHGAAGVSLLASRLALRSALPAVLGDGSWFLAARRSYFDQILPADYVFPYHLTDVQGGATWLPPGDGTVRVTGYTGRDVLDLTEGAGGAASALKLAWEWGNDVLGVRWAQPIGGGWASDVRLGFSRYAEELGFPEFEDVRFGSRIEQWMLRADMEREVSPTLELRFGGEVDRMAYDNHAEAGGTQFFQSADDGVLSAGYFSARWHPTERWLLEPGLRADAWMGSDNTRTTLSPRFAVKRFFGAERDGAVKLSVGRYVQFLHSLRDEDFPISNDTWILAGRVVPHVVSDQAQLGVERYWGDAWYASAETYVRDFDGVIAVNPADNPNDLDDDYLVGDGLSYGLDFLVRRTTGRLTGWLALSLLSAERSFPDPLALGFEEEPHLLSYPPIFDRRVDADLVLQYELPWELEMGARWNYGSGLPYTRPIAQHLEWDYDLATGQYEPDDRGRGLSVVLGPRNEQRYQPYHRLDVTLRRAFTLRWGTVVPYLQVLNLYNRQNVLFYFYDFAQPEPTRSGVSMFPVLPTLGVEVTF